MVKFFTSRSRTTIFVISDFSLVIASFMESRTWSLIILIIISLLFISVILMRIPLSSIFHALLIISPAAVITGSTWAASPKILFDLILLYIVFLINLMVVVFDCSGNILLTCIRMIHLIFILLFSRLKHFKWLDTCRLGGDQFELCLFLVN